MSLTYLPAVGTIGRCARYATKWVERRLRHPGPCETVFRQGRSGGRASDSEGVVVRLRLFSGREQLVLRTHEPPFRLSAWAVGQVVEHEGRLFRVTRWEELPPVVLERGGSLKQWEVWGRKMSNRQIQREIVNAAEAILEAEPPEKSER